MTIENNPLTTTVIVRDAHVDGREQQLRRGLRLAEPAANGECGVFQNLNFGSSNLTANRYDPDLLRGFGVRDALWNVTARGAATVRRRGSR